METSFRQNYYVPFFQNSEYLWRDQLCWQNFRLPEVVERTIINFHPCKPCLVYYDTEIRVQIDKDPTYLPDERKSNYPEQMVTLSGSIGGEKVDLGLFYYLPEK